MIYIEECDIETGVYTQVTGFYGDVNIEDVKKEYEQLIKKFPEGDFRVIEVISSKWK